MQHEDYTIDDEVSLRHCRTSDQLCPLGVAVSLHKRLFYWLAIVPSQI